MNATAKPTTEMVRKIKVAIAECDAYIERESKRADDLRPKEIQDRLAFYRSHREKLIRML